MDGGPVAGKRQGHGLRQGPRGCAGFSLGDDGHIAARRRVSCTAGAGRVQSRGQLAYHRKLEDSSHDKSQGPCIRAGFGQVGGGHVAGRREGKRSTTILQVQAGPSPVDIGPAAGICSGQSESSTTVGSVSSSGRRAGVS
jgi:hypothetical protein